MTTRQIETREDMELLIEEVALNIKAERDSKRDKEHSDNLLKTSSTKTLLYYLDWARKHGTVFYVSEYDTTRYLYKSEIIAELNTREHVPTSKKEKRELRRQRQMENRKNGKRNGTKRR